MSLEDLVIRVYGTPAPQGSKKAYVRGNRAVIVDTSKKLAPWRNAVTAAALLERGSKLQLEGPVQVGITFYLDRPASVKPSKRPYPCVAPDLDKLCRSTLDGLTDAGVYRDDSQVVDFVHLGKRYASGFPGFEPGALIIVRMFE